MAQQINLYNPALRKQREWLTLGNVALLVLVMAVLLAEGWLNWVMLPLGLSKDGSAKSPSFSRSNISASSASASTRR